MSNYVKFMRGSPSAYANLAVKSSDTLYFVYEKDAKDGILYLGNKEIAGGGDVTPGASSLSDLQDVKLKEFLTDKDILAYDSKNNCWVNITLEDLIPIFTGATDFEAGVGGLVPGPSKGQTNLFLKSDGTWAPIDINDGRFVFTVENEDPNKPHSQIIEEATANLENFIGNIIIIKDIIYANHWKYSAYVFNGSRWTALNGDYNAENVYFDSDLVFTEPVGTVTIPETGSTVVPAAGKNVKELLTDIFTQSRNPETVQPSVSITAPDNIYHEVGKTITPTYFAQFDPGSYTFGPPTAIAPLRWIVKDNEGNQEPDLPLSSSVSGEMPKVLVKDDTSYKIEVKCVYPEGSMPRTNLGIDYPKGKIKAGTTPSTFSSELKGYRAFFYGADDGTEIIDSDFIRNLTFGGHYSEEKILELNASSASKRFIIAIPADGDRMGLKRAIITTSLNADVTKEYVLQPKRIMVEGFNHYQAIPYKVWVYQPAVISETEKHLVTLG